MKVLSRGIDFLASILNTLSVNSKVLPREPVTEYELDVNVPTFYIGRLIRAPISPP